MGWPSDAVKACITRWASVLLWCLVASLMAPTAFTLGIGIAALVHGAGIMAIPTMLFIGYFAFLVSLFFGLLPYVVLLLGWAAIAPRIRIGERSFTDVMVLTALLAVPAGIAAFTWGGDRAPMRGVMVWLAAWIGLAVPRLTCRWLRPGTFLWPRPTAPAS